MTPGFKFINILCADFTHIDPKSVKAASKYVDEIDTWSKLDIFLLEFYLHDEFLLWSMDLFSKKSNCLADVLDINVCLYQTLKMVLGR